jgi:hypothetical protein
LILSPSAAIACGDGGCLLVFCLLFSFSFDLICQTSLISFFQNMMEREGRSCSGPPYRFSLNADLNTKTGANRSVPRERPAPSAGISPLLWWERVGEGENKLIQAGWSQGIRGRIWQRKKERADTETHISKDVP